MTILCRCRHLGWTASQPDEERRPHAGRAFDPDLTTMRLDDLVADRQPYAGSLVFVVSMQRLNN